MPTDPAPDLADEGRDITELEAAREGIRNELTYLVACLEEEDSERGLAAAIAELADAYVTLGGNLELADQDKDDELGAARARLTRLENRIAELDAATENLALEDFPPRLSVVAAAVNAVIAEARA